MVLTKDELIAALQNEVRILLHLAGKVDRTMLDYRPTPKQRTTLDVLRYLTYMGPLMVRAIKAGGFDGEAWGTAVAEANAATFEQVVATIEKQGSLYADLLGGFSDADFRNDIDLFGRGKASRGSVIVSMVLGGHVAYRMQLFLYLKACGREELNTMNLWAGMDAPMATA